MGDTLTRGESDDVDIGGDPDAWRSEPILAGLIGIHIQGSRSPDIHMAEAEAQGFRLAYKLFDLAQPDHRQANLASIIDAVQRAGFSGVNVTHPFKQQVIEQLDELSPEAREVGAVNTVLFRSGRKIGHNTDCYGFEESFKGQLPNARLRKVVQLGAGGAGAATAAALLHLGCGELVVLDPQERRSRELVERLARSGPDTTIRWSRDLEFELSGADGIINATPIGMASHPGTPVPARLLKPGIWVAEIVYFPLETELLRNARQIGCRTADGSQMVIFQAARAFELFTGRMADRDRMIRQFSSSLDENASNNG